MKKIKDLKLEEKLPFLSGVDCWSLPKFDGKTTLRMSDGPHGLRYVYKEENFNQISKKNRAYPSLSTLANSWDKNTLYKIGQCIAEDCIDENVEIILGPGVNLKRHPFCGRNFEYFSEDSFLSGKMSASYINGVQSKGVAACIKHYACNNRERDRFYESSEVDIRALHEEFLKPFEIAIKESNPFSLMCSYNPINGIYASENKYLLIDVLRNEFGYEGVTISDWGATRNRAISLKNGIDISMPYSEYFVDHLKLGLEKGYIDEEIVDRSISRIDNLRQKLEDLKDLRKVELTKEERFEACVKADEESIVLLKNDDILPIYNKEEKILLVGDFAINPLTGGEGSSKVTPLKEDLSILPDFQKMYKNAKFESCFNRRYGLIEPFGVKRAVLEAKKADKVVVFLGTNELTEKEETDKNLYQLDENLYEIINRIYEVNKNIVVVLESGGPVDLKNIPEIAKGIIYAGVGGEGINKALLRIISGEVSPSGKLSETFIKEKDDSYAKKGNFFYEKYSEGVLVGYKYYLTNNIPVQYEFGYGLSYASFEYSNLKIDKIGQYSYEITFDVTNNSDIDAKCVSEIYVSNTERMVQTSKKSLVEFDKSLIKAHETKTIKVTLNKEAFSYYSTILSKNYVEDGDYEISICSSLTKEELVGRITIDDENPFKYSRF